MWWITQWHCSSISERQVILTYDGIFWVLWLWREHQGCSAPMQTLSSFSGWVYHEPPLFSGQTSKPRATAYTCVAFHPQMRAQLGSFVLQNKDIICPSFLGGLLNSHQPQGCVYLESLSQTVTASCKPEEEEWWVIGTTWLQECSWLLVKALHLKWLNLISSVECWFGKQLCPLEKLLKFGQTAVFSNSCFWPVLPRSQQSVLPGCHPLEQSTVLCSYFPLKVMNQNFIHGHYIYILSIFSSPPPTPYIFPYSLSPIKCSPLPIIILKYNYLYLSICIYN